MADKPAKKPNPPIYPWQYPSDPKVRQEVLDLIEESGVPPYTACGACSIKKSTFEQYCARHPEFVEECEAAHGRFVRNAHRAWRKAPSNEWSKFATMLERRAPSMFANPSDQLLFQAVSDMDPNEFRRAIAEGMTEMRRRFAPPLPAPAVDADAKDAEFEVRDS